MSDREAKLKLLDESIYELQKLIDAERARLNAECERSVADWQARMKALEIERLEIEYGFKVGSEIEIEGRGRFRIVGIDINVFYRFKIAPYKLDGTVSKRVEILYTDLSKVRLVRP